MITAVDIPALLEKKERSLRVENLHHCTQITPDQLKELTKKMSTVEEDNSKLLEIIEHEKMAYIFSSADLLKVLNTTESVKTRLKIIQEVAPRLSDPRSKMGEIQGLFRFSEEKSLVEEALKQRAHVMSNAMFSTGGVQVPSSSMHGGRGGRGGRG